MNNRGIEIIEAKLELGLDHYSAQEVVFLLNQIRDLKSQLGKEKESKYVRSIRL